MIDDQQGNHTAPKREIDMDAIRANLKLTPEQRIMKLKANANFILSLRAALKSSHTHILVLDELEAIYAEQKNSSPDQ